MSLFREGCVENAWICFNCLLLTDPISVSFFSFFLLLLFSFIVLKILDDLDLGWVIVTRDLTFLRDFSLYPCEVLLALIGNFL